MLGGDIVSIRNLTEGTLLEMLQKPLDATDRPLDTDQTERRFMALCDGHLDPAVYSKGRQVTLAELVLGTRTDTVGEITYGYCWPTSFKVLEVLFLGEVSSAFLPSKKACWAHQFRYLGVGQQYPYVYPLLACLEVYLWPPMPDTRTLYPYGYWWPGHRPY
jgi:hypothetical protein